MTQGTGLRHGLLGALLGPWLGWRWTPSGRGWMWVLLPSSPHPERLNVQTQGADPWTKVAGSAGAEPEPPQPHSGVPIHEPMRIGPCQGERGASRSPAWGSEGPELLGWPCPLQPHVDWVAEPSEPGGRGPTFAGLTLTPIPAHLCFWKTEPAPQQPCQLAAIPAVTPGPLLCSSKAILPSELGPTPAQPPAGPPCLPPRRPRPSC